MTRPVRLRLSRVKDFDLQTLSQATNGLPAVNVARPSRWGNPYRVTPECPADEAVRMYRHDLEWDLADALAGDALRADIEAALRGKNLACWCGPGEPCHTDVLIAIANPKAEDS